MRYILLTLVALYSTSAKPLQSTDESINELTEYVEWFFQQSGPEYRKKAIREYIPLVVAYSKEFGVDPLLVATVISHESGWRANVVGKSRSEIGLMQVHGVARGEALRRRIPLSTPRGQLVAGVSWLKRGLDKCDDTVKALGWYMTGKCKNIRAARMRHRHYLKALRLFRNES